MDDAPSIEGGRGSKAYLLHQEMHKRQHVLVERRGGGIFSTSDGQSVGVRHEPAGGKADASVSDSCNEPSIRLFVHGSMVAEHRYFDTRQDSPFAYRPLTNSALYIWPAF